MNIKLKEVLAKVLSAISTLMTATGTVTPYATRSVSQTATISSKSGYNFGPSIPSVSGYTFIGVIGWGQNHGNTVYITSTSTTTCYCYNGTSSSMSTTVSGTAVYIKNSLAKGR